jgi:hypothetical protein
MEGSCRGRSSTCRWLRSSGSARRGLLCSARHGRTGRGRCPCSSGGGVPSSLKEPLEPDWEDRAVAGRESTGELVGRSCQVSVATAELRIALSRTLERYGR